MRRTLILVAAAALAVGFLPAGGAGVSAETQRSPAALAITGYAYGSPQEVRRDAATVSDLGIDGATLSRDGSRIRTYPGLRRALAAAHDAGRPGSLLLSNYDNRRGDFSPAIGRAMLRDSANRAGVAAALADEVATSGWDGVTVDIENIRGGDRRGLVAFVAALRSHLGAGTTVDVDVPATTHPAGWSWKPFDLPALAAEVDHITLMAYDQHWSTGRPGPIAGIRWVRRSLAAALGRVPAAKLRLGVAGYGYVWRDGRPARTVSASRARSLAGQRAHWARGAAEWHARLSRGRTLWFSDARAMHRRFLLARTAGLDGAAVWRLGSADRITAAVAGGPVSARGGS